LAAGVAAVAVVFFLAVARFFAVAAFLVPATLRLTLFFVAAAMVVLLFMKCGHE
jgi:hypothetical protein